MKMIKIYLSHPIRGPKGKKATQKDMDENNRKAIEVGEQLRTYFWEWHSFDGLPEIKLYIPAEHEDVILYLYYKGYITVDNILEADCNIVKNGDLMLMYGNPKYSSGMRVELDCAMKNDVPVVSFNELNEGTLFAIRHTIDMIIKGRK